MSNQNNFQSQVVDRVSETQLQVGENSDWVIWRLKGSFYCIMPCYYQLTADILPNKYARGKIV